MWDREDRSLTKISDILVQACCLCGQQERAVLFRTFLLCWAKFIRNVWWKFPWVWYGDVRLWTRAGTAGCWLLSRDLCHMPSEGRLEMAGKNFLFLLEFLRKFAEMTSSLHAYKIQPWRLTVTLATDGARQKPVKATLTCCLKVTDLVVLLRNFYASFENGSKERVCNGTHSTAVLTYTDIAGENLSEWSS